MTLTRINFRASDLAMVSFIRPLDASWFRRGDGYREHGSAFNPYWQPRLVETSHADRVAALELQQGVDIDRAANFPVNLTDFNALWTTLTGRPLIATGN